jgi:hypothetical protein
MATKNISVYVDGVSEEACEKTEKYIDSVYGCEMLVLNEGTDEEVSVEDIYVSTRLRGGLEVQLEVPESAVEDRKGLRDAAKRWLEDCLYECGCTAASFSCSALEDDEFTMTAEKRKRSPYEADSSDDEDDSSDDEDDDKRKRKRRKF